MGTSLQPVSPAFVCASLYLIIFGNRDSHSAYLLLNVILKYREVRTIPVTDCELIVTCDELTCVEGEESTEECCECCGEMLTGD